MGHHFNELNMHFKKARCRLPFELSDFSQMIGPKIGRNQMGWDVWWVYMSTYNHVGMQNMSNCLSLFLSLCLCLCLSLSLSLSLSLCLSICLSICQTICLSRLRFQSRPLQAPWARSPSTPSQSRLSSKTPSPGHSSPWIPRRSANTSTALAVGRNFSMGSEDSGPIGGGRKVTVEYEKAPWVEATVRSSLPGSSANMYDMWFYVNHGRDDGFLCVHHYKGNDDETIPTDFLRQDLPRTSLWAQDPITICTG